jgi:MYXO-CTERM domain-containing protein
LEGRLRRRSSDSRIGLSIAADYGELDMHSIHLTTFATCIAGLISPHGTADVIEFEEKSEWIDAVGEFSTIGFSDLPDGTWVFEQYSHLGAHFVDGADIVHYGDITYPEDGVGLDGNTEIRVVFDEPLTHIAVDYPGNVQFELFREGSLVYLSTEFGHSFIGQFAGLQSTELFDEVRIFDPEDDAVFIDDIHFGPPIPAPGALALFALTLIGSTRRRRT